MSLAIHLRLNYGLVDDTIDRHSTHRTERMPDNAVNVPDNEEAWQLWRMRRQNGLNRV